MQQPSTGPVRPSRAASRTRRGHALVALTGALLLVMTSVADARSRGSMGSRGSRTNDAPAATQTAPTTAQPMQRTQTTPAQTQARPGTPGAPAAAQPAASRFGGGFFAGLLGAGLLGALFGAGFFGGLGSLTAILGLLLQVALIGGLIWLALRFFRRRSAPSYAGQNPAALRSSLGPTPPQMGGAGLGGMSGGLGVGAAGGKAPPAAQGTPVEVGPADYEAFERTLHEVQGAYDRGDAGALRMLTTPELASYFEEELDTDARKGLKAHVTDVKLLQGDLAEAWRENGSEYASVVMRFNLKECLVEDVTGRVVNDIMNSLS